ncbi:MAG: glycosyltransferase family 2 protein [Bacillota bacterium]
MNIVITMAGEGRRFKSAGWDLPKMLIPVAGHPMLYWALLSLKKIIRDNSVIFICLKRDLERYPLQAAILDLCPKAQIIEVPSVTKGQAMTVLASKDHIDIKAPLLVYNCDTFMDPAVDLSDIYNITRSYDGFISVFKENDPNYSYVQLDENNLVTYVEEKRVISSWATTGLYHFSTPSLFYDAVNEAVQRENKVQGEYYIAPLYNHLTEKGYRIISYQANFFHSLGTPKDAALFEFIYSKGGNNNS